MGFAYKTSFVHFHVLKTLSVYLLLLVEPDTKDFRILLQTFLVVKIVLSAISIVNIEISEALWTF